jgi:hypothetical protein
MSKKFASEFSSNGAAAVGDKLLIQKLTDSTVNYITVAHLFTNPTVAGLIALTPSTDRGLMIGYKGIIYANGTTYNIPITSVGGTLDANTGTNFMLGVFTKITGNEASAPTDDLGSAWFRTRVSAAAATPADYSVYGSKSQLRVYGGSTTTISNWAAAGSLGVLEVSGASTTFASGCIAAAVYGNVSLTSDATIAAGAVVAGVAAISASASITDTGAAYYGVYVGKSGAVAFDAGLKVAASACTTGIDIGTATTGIKLSGTITNAIDVTAVTTLSNLIKFDSVAGCVITGDVNPTGTTGDNALGADAKIRILINATPYYIPLFTTVV